MKQQGLFLILFSISNLFFISYLYKKVIEQDDNFNKLNRKTILSIMNKNFYLLLFSVILILPFSSMFVVTFISLFLTKFLIVVFAFFLSTLYISLVPMIIFYAQFIEHHITKKIPNKIKNNSNLNQLDNKSRIATFIMLFMIIHVYIYTQYNINNFAKMVSHKIVNNNFNTSFSIIFNTGLIDKTKHKTIIQSNKSIQLPNFIKQQNDLIVLPNNSKNIVSNHLQVSEKIYLYFLRKSSEPIVSTFLVKVSDNKKNYILMDYVSKNFDEI